MKKLWILPLAAVMMVACGNEETEEEGNEETDNTEATTPDPEPEPEPTPEPEPAPAPEDTTVNDEKCSG